MLILASDASMAPSANCSGLGTETSVVRFAEVPVNASCTAFLTASKMDEDSEHISLVERECLQYMYGKCKCK